MSNGWYIESLLRNREKIRSSAVEKNYIKISGNREDITDDPDILFPISMYNINFDENPILEVEEFNFLDDDYNNLLLVEKKLGELIRNKQLSTEEANVTIGILQHVPLKELGEKLNIQSSLTIIGIFRKVCSRLEFLLGDGFSDEGYLAYLAEKYNLSEEQIQIGRDYMDSNKRLLTKRIK